MEYDVVEDLRPAECVFGLPDPEADDLGLEFTIRCGGPEGSDCVCTGRDCGLIERIHGLSWEEGQRIIDEGCGVLASSRWCCGCGMHTRLWVLCDGSLLFSHDWEYYSGAHLVVLAEPARTLLARLNRERWERSGRSCECRLKAPSCGDKPQSTIYPGAQHVNGR